MISILDLWKIPYPIVYGFLTTIYTPYTNTSVLDAYIDITFYAAQEGFLFSYETEYVLDREFGEELYSDNVMLNSMDDDNRLKYLMDYMKNRDIRESNCLSSNIIEGKLIDDNTKLPITGNFIIRNGHCYAK